MPVKVVVVGLLLESAVNLQADGQVTDAFSLSLLMKTELLHTVFLFDAHNSTKSCPRFQDDAPTIFTNRAHGFNISRTRLSKTAPTQYYL